MLNDRQIKGGLPTRRQGSAAAKYHKAEEAPLLKKVMISSLLGVGACGGIGMIFLCVLCFFAMRSEDPLSLIAPLSLLALLPSNFVGGLVASRKTGEAPLACGIVTAALWGVISLAVALCASGAEASGYAVWQTVILHVLSALFCILGAFAGNYKPKRKPGRHRRFGR